MDDLALVSCGRPDCPVALTGSCSEGHDPPRSCPFYGAGIAVDLEDYDDNSAEASSVVDEDRFPLPSGELLTPEGVDAFLREKSAKLIGIVGEHDSGKTTLVCSIYEQFLRGPFAGYLFAGSRTLIGFERRAHYARVDSGRTYPDTPRTSISEDLRFFHLAVVREDSAATRSDLMLSDRAGETYGQARNNSEMVRILVEVSKAHCVVILLDGGRVANPVERAGAMQAVRQTLRTLLDGEGIGSESRVQIVTTKRDLLLGHAEEDAIEETLSRFRQRLKDDFEDRLAELSFWEIAARDPKGNMPPAYGVDALFLTWIAPRPARAERRELVKPLVTEFDKLLLRTPMDVDP